MTRATDKTPPPETDASQLPVKIPKAVQILLPLMWVFLAIGLGGVVLWHGQKARQQEFLGLMVPIFFSVGALGLLTRGWCEHRRRAGTWLLALGASLWGAGSALVNSPGGQRPEFPGRYEALFLICYVVIVAGLLVEVRSAGRVHRSSRKIVVWLETAVILGSTASIAGFLFLLTRLIVAETDRPVLFATLYPTLDIAVILVLVTQAYRGFRPRDRGLILSCLGWSLLAICDSDILGRTLSNPTDVRYPDSMISATGYAIGWALLFTGSWLQPNPNFTRRLTKPLRPESLVLAGILPLGLLVQRATNDLWSYWAIPALATIVAVVARLIVTLADAERERDLAHTDELTGLANRRAFTTVTEESLARNSPMVIMMIDLDRFKAINDTHGHIVGDQVLATIGARLARQLRAPNLVARLGGDEFAIVQYDLPDQPEHLLAWARELRMIAMLPVPTRGEVSDHSLRVGITIGITITRPDDQNLGDMLARADSAMYQAKSSDVGVGFS